MARTCQPKSGRLDRAVDGLGAIGTVAYTLLAIGSMPLAAALWRSEEAPRAEALFSQIENASRAWAPALAPTIAAAFHLDVVTALVVHTALIVVPTVIAATLIHVMSDPNGKVTGPTVTRLKVWAVIFSIVCVFAYPVFTQDFWLSAVWGRMIVNGANPYHQTFDAGDVASLPLDHFAMPMSYGPLWAVLSAGVMSVARDNVFLAGLLFKIALLMLWLCGLWAVGRLTADEPASVQARATVIYGWLPAGSYQVIAEGHNDGAMATGIVIWLLLAARSSVFAAVALMASALCKYASLPLAVIEAVALATSAGSRRDKILRILLPVVFATAILAVFYRSPDFFDGIHVIGDWRFLQPRDALAGLERVTGWGLGGLKDALPMAVALVLFVASLRAVRRLDETAKSALASLAIMTVVLLMVVPHLWPWYVVWVLGLAAVAPRSWLSDLVVGLAVFSPFTLVAWWVEPLAQRLDLVSLGLYVAVAGWVFGCSYVQNRGENCRTAIPLTGARA